MAALQLFCERIASPAPHGLLAEPANALTSLAFVGLAAWLGQRLLAGGLPPPRAGLRGAGAGDALALWGLAGWVGALGTASLALHTLATPAAAAADLWCVQGLMLWFAACCGRWIFGLPWRGALAGVPLFALAAQAWVQLGGGLDGGLHRHGPGVAALALCALWLARRHDPVWRAFAQGAALYLLAALLHGLDAPWCRRGLPLPALGTHAGWHLVNLLAIALLARALIDRALAERRLPVAPPRPER